MYANIILHFGAPDGLGLGFFPCFVHVWVNPWSFESWGKKVNIYDFTCIFDTPLSLTCDVDFWDSRRLFASIFWQLFANFGNVWCIIVDMEDIRKKTHIYQFFVPALKRRANVHAQNPWNHRIGLWFLAYHHRFRYCMDTHPIGSMYGIFTYIYHKKQPNVGEYTIHGSYGHGTNCPVYLRFLVTNKNWRSVPKQGLTWKIMF